mgnify:CR=1 FL=1
MDLIFTDPPYAKQFLRLYQPLAREASRILRVGGFFLALCGGAYLDQVFAAFNVPGLEFFWKYEIELAGKEGGMIWPRGNTKVPIMTRSKPVLAYSKGRGLPRTGTLGLFTSNGADKRWHHWGQDVSSARYFIDCFTASGDLICDPMVGGGTTGIACQLIGRRFIGFDIDPVACRISKDRLEHSDAMTDMPLFQT